jgi:hypothetical protein
MTLILSGTDGLSDVDGSAATPAIRGTDANTGIFFPAADTIAFSEGGVESMRIDSSGNVGIGTSSPTQRLTVLNSNGTYGTAYQPIMQIGNTSSGGTVGDPTGLGAIVWSTDGTTTPTASIEAVRENPGVGAASALYFRTGSSGGGTTRAVITSGGNLLVGTTSGTSRLSVSSANNSANSGFFEHTGTSGVAVMSATSASYASAVLALNSTTVSGTGWKYLACYSGNFASERLFIRGDGNVYNVNGTYGSISDIKLKENIVDATPKLANLMQVKIRNYNMIGDTTKQIGVVAQELEQIFPSMVDETVDYDRVVTTDEDGKEKVEQVAKGTTTKSVKYSVFVPMLIKALQEQQAIITQLQADVAALKGTA